MIFKDNVHLATKIVKDEIDNILKSQNAEYDIDAIVLTEAYPLDDENELLKYLIDNGYTVFPYDNSFNEFLESVNDLTTYKDEKTNKFIPFKRIKREIVGVDNETKEEYVQNDYSNGVIIAVKKELGFRLSGYKIDNPNYLSINNGNICVVGTRVNMGYLDMTNQFKKKLNYKALQGIKLSSVNTIGANYVLENKKGNVFNEVTKDYINDYIIRRANFEYIKEKFNKVINSCKDKKVIVIGDFNIDERFKDFKIWKYDDIIAKDNNFKICRDATIGNAKMDYVYTNLKVDTNDFIAIRKIEEIYCNESIHNFAENVINNITIKSPFPDHNLLFASIDLGSG